MLLCKGCRCDKAERGPPEVAVDRIKAAWKAEKLNRAVRLTISGCLEPCDLPNVAVVVTPAGSHWFGLIAGDIGFQVFFLVCVIIAGLYGTVTASRRILFVQVVPGALALLFVLLAR